MFTFAENQTVPLASFGATVPEDFRNFYVEKDGAMVLNTEDKIVKASVSIITGVHQSLKVARAEAQGFKGKAVDLAALSEYGDTPETIAEGIQTAIDEIKSASKTKGGEELERRVTKIKEELQAAHNTAMEGKEKRIEGLTGQLHGHLVTSTATAALASAKAIDADLVLPHLLSQVKVNEEDGKLTVSVVDAAGDPRYSGTTGAPMTLPELVGEMKGNKKFEPLFESEAHSGGGGNHTTHRPGQHTGGGDKSSIQKISGGVSRGGTGNTAPAGMK